MTSNRRLTTQELADWIIDHLILVDHSIESRDDLSKEYLIELDEAVWEIIDKVLDNYNCYEEEKK